MKIFYSPASPFVRKCMVVAHELGMADRIEKLPSAAGPVKRDATIIPKNPLGQVPTFITDDGQVLFEGRPDDAIKIGEFAYGQNCARCHGLEAISGGIAPDLRYLELGDTGDEWFVQRYHHGSSHDGKVYMPPMGEILGQKAGWAIRAWLETKHTDE